MAMSNTSANRTLLWKLSLVALGMFAFGFALAPFYSKICEVIGLNQIQTRDAVAANTQVDATRSVQLQFDANLRNELPWTFKPLTPVLSVHPGQLVHVVYEAVSYTHLTLPTILRV